MHLRYSFVPHSTRRDLVSGPWSVSPYPPRGESQAQRKELSQELRLSEVVKFLSFRHEICMDLFSHAVLSQFLCENNCFYFHLLTFEELISNMPRPVNESQALKCRGNPGTCERKDLSDIQPFYFTSLSSVFLIRFLY